MNPSKATHLIWTLRNICEVQPFLDKYFPEREPVTGMEDVYDVDGGRLKIAHKSVIMDLEIL
jgi:hypothetical protein